MATAGEQFGRKFEGQGVGFEDMLAGQGRLWRKRGRVGVQVGPIPYVGMRHGIWGDSGGRCSSFLGFALLFGFWNLVNLGWTQPPSFLRNKVKQRDIRSGGRHIYFETGKSLTHGVAGHQFALKQGRENNF